MNKIFAEDLVWYGRYSDVDGKRYFDFSASGFEVCMTGKSCALQISSDTEFWPEENKPVLGIYVKEISSESDYKVESFWENFDESSFAKKILKKAEEKIVLFESPVAKTVVIKVLKLSEVNFGTAGFNFLEIDGKQVKAPVESGKKREQKLKIEIIGDSITCGYGIEGVFNKDTFTTAQQRADKSYAFKTAKALGAEFEYCSWSGIGITSKYVDETVNIPNVEVVMPGIWPYTDKSLAMRMKKEPEVWDEKKFSPDLVIIHLGTNDASFVREVEERRVAFVCCYEQFLEAIHRRSPNAKILCCLGVMGQNLCDSVDEAIGKFTEIFRDTKVCSVKFPVQDENDGIGADWHPSEKTHEKMALQLTEKIKEFLRG